MDAIRRTLRRLLTDQTGATAVEYGLIAALIIVAMIGGLSALGGGANGMWGQINAEVQNAEVLITECTFFDPDHRTKAKAGKHLHVEVFAEILPKLKNGHVVIGHVTRRTGIRRAWHLLRRRVGDERMKNVQFLMDFEGAVDAGDIEDSGPPPADGAE